MSLCDEDYTELDPDLVRRIRYYRSRLERSVEQELAQTGSEAFLASSSSSDGAGSAHATANVAVEERTVDVSNGGGAPSTNDAAIVVAGAAGGALADANWGFGAFDDDAVEPLSPSTDGASVTIWETSTCGTESGHQHEVAASPVDDGTSAPTLEDQDLELKMPSIWPADPLEQNRDPLGDIS